STGATFTQWGDHTIIDTDHGAIINWKNFSTEGTHSVTFNQFDSGALSEASAVLNRVNSGTVPTQFNGALTANGRVFIVNPAGIIFGSGSTVNVSQLVASGLNMSDDAFKAILEDPANEMQFVGGDGDVTNLGTIRADKVYLVGKTVTNRYGITAQNGLVVLAAGDNVFLAQDGSNVLVQVADVSDGTPDVENRSLISAGNGSIVLAAGDTMSRAISNSGIISAASGSITARAARIENKGTISANGDGGSITLAATEQVTLDYWNNEAGTGLTTANGGADQNGGTINIESEGSVIITENAAVQAAGGTGTGNGGSVNITADNFIIAGEVDASPDNPENETGTLTINTANVTIANGANAGEIDTIYEQDIEALSEKGTSVVINSEQGITIPDMIDGEIKGRRGNIELYGTGADSFVNFEDPTNTISTTRGDIIIGAGSGGLDIGNLETGKDLSDADPTAGQIILSTFNRGNIKTGNLFVKDGWGHAEINVNSSGELAANGNIIVGSNAPILNIPNGQDAEAMIFLKAGDNIVINGDIAANAHGLNAGVESGITKAYIGIFAGTNETWFGNLIVNGDLTAKAISTSVGTSDATIEIDSWGSITWGQDAADPLAEGDAGQVSVQSKESDSRTSPDGDVARIIVNAQGNAPEADGVPDFETTHMGTTVEGNVLDNDAHPEGEVLGARVIEGPKHDAEFDMDGGGNWTYTPEPGFVGEDTFTYIASPVSGGEPTEPVLVTITVTNNAPVGAPKSVTVPMSLVFSGSVEDAMSDPDDDPVKAGLITGPEHGTVEIFPDGSYHYIPEAGYVGTDSFTYSVSDGEIGADPSKGVVTLTLMNTAPTPYADAAATIQSAAIAIDVLANDSDPEGHSLKVTSFDYTGAGSVVINADNTLTYTPPDDFIGKETFTYSATDGEIGGTPVTSTVTVTVGPSVTTPPAYFMPTGPDLDKTDVRISGCPALTAWAAEEVGVSRRRLEIWVGNGLASVRGVQPCEACKNLREAAKILADAQGIHTAAIEQIINEFGTSTGPMTEEMAAYITNALARDSGTREHYKLADEYFAALADYVGTLHNDMDFSVARSARIATRKYIDPLVSRGHIGVASYVGARLDSLTTFLNVVRLNRGKEKPQMRY
ncbi:MAG: Ig-like domain-containing protein, partial [Planctomycetota bacterium]